MPSSAKASSGLVDSLRTFGGNLLGSVRERIELLSLELQEEKLRFIQLFLWINVTAFAGVMAAAFATLAVVYLFWDTARLAVLAGFALLYLGVAIGAAIGFRRFLARQPRPLDATLQELSEDETCIRPPN